MQPEETLGSECPRLAAGLWPGVPQGRGGVGLGEKVEGSRGVRAATTRKSFNQLDTASCAKRRVLASSNQSGRAFPPSPWQRDANARAGRSDGLGRALGNRIMSRQKVGVPLDPDVPSSQRGREIAEGFRSCGVLVEEFRLEWEENDEFREKTTSPGMPRNAGVPARVQETQFAGGKFMKL